MAMQQFVRGQTILWTVEFTDARGDAFTPGSASLRVRYYDAAENSAEIDELIMVEDDGEWTCVWESAQAKPGPVHWSIRTSGGGDVEAIDGVFRLTANEANQVVEPYA